MTYITKRLSTVRARVTEEEFEAVKRFCAERGVTESELVRRGLKAVLAADSTHAPQGAPAPAAPRHAVRKVNDIGGDSLAADNGALKR